MFYSVDFFLVMLILYPTYFFLKSKKHQVILLLLSSYLIYFNLQGFFLLYLILISLVAYFSVKVYKFNFSRLSNFFGVIIPLLGLAWFKYYHYLISLEIVNFSYILPAGISFFTFQAISYVLDRKKERINNDTDDSLLDVLFYISFFPQLIAGPIVKYNEFNFQISLKKFNFNLFYEGLSVFIYGLFLKIFLADNISEFTGTLNQIDMLNSYGDISKIILVFSYSFQIYFDFSGYSLMAIGLGKTFGYNLPTNFNIPYISSTFSEFWRRWHISLSSFLREYLYIQFLGGNRVNRTYINLFLTMLIGGAWHGGMISYIIWGAGHGIMLVFERMGLYFKNKFFSRIYVFFIVTLLWLPFIYPNFDLLIIFFESFNFNLIFNYSLSPLVLYLFIGFPLAFCKRIDNYFMRPNWQISLVIILLTYFNPGLSSDFIYFQF
jgi:alginate O-acetyltransferase complex protein AlgI